MGTACSAENGSSSLRRQSQEAQAQQAAFGGLTRLKASELPDGFLQGRQNIDPNSLGSVRLSHNSSEKVIPVRVMEQSGTLESTEPTARSFRVVDHVSSDSEGKSECHVSWFSFNGAKKIIKVSTSPSPGVQQTNAKHLYLKADDTLTTDVAFFKWVNEHGPSACLKDKSQSLGSDALRLEGLLKASHAQLLISHQVGGDRGQALLAAARQAWGSSATSQSSATVQVNPKGPYANQTQSPVQHEVSDLPACASMARQPARAYKLCIEGMTLTKTDPRADWAGMSEAQKESFANTLQAGLARGQSWPFVYACQCQLAKCGMSKVTQDQSIITDTFGAFYFERSAWGFCKRY
jgi:hypothetical protein